MDGADLIRVKMDTRSLSILVVEDNDDMRNIAMECLDGHNRRGARTMKEGFNIFKELCPDITFLDIGLPDGDGLQLLNDMLSYNPESYIVMLTKSALPQDVKMALQSGAKGYIVKPFSRFKLKDAIFQYFDFQKKLAVIPPEERAKSIASRLDTEVANKYSDKPKDIQHKALEEDIKNLSVDEINKMLSETNILFIDDYSMNREYAKQHFEDIGCNVDTAGSRSEVIKLLGSRGYHIIFVDDRMKDTDGYNLAIEIRSELSRDNPYIIAMVERQADADDKLWQQAKMDTYVMKPAKFKQLQEMVRDHVIGVMQSSVKNQKK